MTVVERNVNRYLMLIDTLFNKVSYENKNFIMCTYKTITLCQYFDTYLFSEVREVLPIVLRPFDL